MSLPFFTTIEDINGEPVYNLSVFAEHYSVDIEAIKYYRSKHNGRCSYYIIDTVKYKTLKKELIGISRILKIQNIKDRQQKT